MEERLLAVLAETNEEIPSYEGDNMIEDGLLDSFQVMDLVGDLEDEFEIEIDAKYVVEENFRTVEAILTLLEMIMNQ